MAEEACHGFGSTTRVGLTQALGIRDQLMDYQSAKQVVLTKRLGGAALFVVSVAFALAGILLFLYSSLDSAGQVLTALSPAIKRLVYSIFDSTRFLLPIWENASVPDPDHLTSKGTLGFLGWYIGVFIGASLIGSANKLAARLRAIDRQIEDEAIRESLKGETARSRAELERQVNVPKQSMWQQVHTLYVAPLVVGIVLYLVGKLVG